MVFLKLLTAQRNKATIMGMFNKMPILYLSSLCYIVQGRKVTWCLCKEALYILHMQLQTWRPCVGLGRG